MRDKKKVSYSIVSGEGRGPWPGNNQSKKLPVKSRRGENEKEGWDLRSNEAEVSTEICPGHLLLVILSFNFQIGKIERLSDSNINQRNINRSTYKVFLAADFGFFPSQLMT